MATPQIDPSLANRDLTYYVDPCPKCLCKRVYYSAREHQATCLNSLCRHQWFANEVPQPTISDLLESNLHTIARTKFLFELKDDAKYNALVSEVESQIEKLCQRLDTLRDKRANVDALIEQEQDLELATSRRIEQLAARVRPELDKVFATPKEKAVAGAKSSKPKAAPKPKVVKIPEHVYNILHTNGFSDEQIATTMGGQILEVIK